MNQRLLSLDTLRGFDMLFIMGGDAFFLCLGALLPGTIFADFAQQMGHKAWDGFALYDLIFPLFLFIAGVSFPFSLAKSRSMDESERKTMLRILRRGLTLVVLGIVYNGLLSFDFENLRVASVLGRIGLAWMLAAFIYMRCSRRVSAIIALAILLGYYALLTLVSAPDAPGASSLSMEGSIVGYVDRLLLPGILHLGIHDPEGILSTLPAVVTALLGIFTGDFIRTFQRWNGHKKALTLLLSGLLLIGLGYAWDFLFPINKNLWTSSFVCVAGGYSMALFAVFYWVVDVMEWRKWTFFFRIIGLNSITIYLAQHFLDVSKPIKTVFGGVLSLLPENMYALGYWACHIALCWLFLYFLYRQKIFLKV